MNYENYTASIRDISKQMDKLEGEIPCWRQKFLKTYKDLEKLKQEIKNTKMSDILQIYLKCKSMEVQSSKQSLLNKHTTTIASEAVNNAHWLQRSYTLAIEVIKNGSLNAEQRYHYDQLQRHLLGTTLGSREMDLDIGDSLMNGVLRSSSDEDVEQGGVEATSAVKKSTFNKRLRLEEYDLDDLDGLSSSDYEDEGNNCESNTTFKMPAKRARTNGALNETHVLSDDSNTNATFFLGPLATSSTTKSKKITRNGKEVTTMKTNLVTNVLSEQIVKRPVNSDQLKNVLMKSKKFTHNNLLRAVAAGVQKENKKYSPNRVKKSPRTLPAKGSAPTAPSLVKRQMARTTPSAENAPVVRINRAASFRTKK